MWLAFIRIAKIAKSRNQRSKIVSKIETFQEIENREIKKRKSFQKSEIVLKIETRFTKNENREIKNRNSHPERSTYARRCVGRGVSSLPGNPLFAYLVGGAHRLAHVYTFAHATLRALYIIVIYNIRIIIIRARTLICFRF